MSRRRLVRELVRRGMASDDTRALELVASGQVLVTGYPATNPQRLVGADEPIVVSAKTRRITRGEEKLAGALDDLGVDLAARRCLDIGAGHGGFTKVLLDRGAHSVTTVDVGYGVLDASLREDPRVDMHERSNFRNIDPAELGPPFDLVVADVSFISLRKLAANIARCTAADGICLVMVKPQFEAPSSDVGVGGVVADPEVWERSIARVAGALAAVDLQPAAVAPSRVRGSSGNQEFFLMARRGATADLDALIEGAISTVGAP